MYPECSHNGVLADMKINEAIDQFTAASPTSQNARKSGAHGYLRRTAKGDPIPVDLYMIQNDVLDALEADGPAGQVKRQAVRLSAASEMLWGHMQTGPKEFNACLKAWGWLCNSAIRGWREVEAMRRSAAVDDVATRKVLEAYDEAD